MTLVAGTCWSVGAGFLTGTSRFNDLRSNNPLCSPRSFSGRHHSRPSLSCSKGESGEPDDCTRSDVELVRVLSDDGRQGVLSDCIFHASLLDGTGRNVMLHDTLIGGLGPDSALWSQNRSAPRISTVFDTADWAMYLPIRPFKAASSFPSGMKGRLESFTSG